MLESRNYLPKKIAWNGISIKTPLSWEIDSLDKTHMLISENGSPCLEIKWTHAPKKFILEKYLKSFLSKSIKILNINIQELPTPTSFYHPEKHFEFFFFSWESDSSTGKGSLIFCSHCKKLTLIRFFSDSRISNNSIQALVLGSFTDHSTDDQTYWQLFGLNFFAPQSFKLVTYSFKPGCYSIKLKHKKTIFTFFSWGPASFLISKKSLAQFAKQRLPQIKGLAKADVCRRGNFLEWSYRHGRFKNAEYLPFFKKFSRYTIFRICHDKQNNRILGILIDSDNKTEHELIKGSIIGNI